MFYLVMLWLEVNLHEYKGNAILLPNDGLYQAVYGLTRVRVLNESGFEGRECSQVQA